MDDVMYASSIDRQGLQVIQDQRQEFLSSTGIMSLKKFKDLSSFGFCINKQTNSVIESSNTDKENDDTIDITKITEETPADISAQTSDVLLASSSIDNAFSDDRLSNLIVEDSSILHSCELKNDIGNYLSNRLSLSDELRYLLLTQHFVPDKKFKWPFVERRTKSTIEKRFLRENHLEDNKPWLVYSPSNAGLFCVPCVLFAQIL